HGEAGPEHALMDAYLGAVVERRPAGLPIYLEFDVRAIQPQTPPGRARENPAPCRGLPCLAHDFPVSGVKAEGLLSVGGGRRGAAGGRSPDRCLLRRQGLCRVWWWGFGGAPWAASGGVTEP